MNKVYKLVYSRKLDDFVAVGEISSAHSKSSTDKREDVKETEVKASKKSSDDKSKSLGNILIGAALLAGAPAVASAAGNNRVSDNQPTQPVATQSLHNGVVADEASSGLSVSNKGGTAVVNIVNPNAHGVSDNRFKSFSTQRGAVFNNSMVELQSKTLGEKLEANPNLRKEAAVILAQVTGGDKSVIKGALEVLGKKADLVIVNPNGIDLNGGSLVNVHDFTASTAEVDANNYKSMNVGRGEINVNGDLTTDDVDTIRLIAQAVKLKATIAPSKEFAKSGKKKANIVVSAGNQKFDLETNTATSTGGKAPRVAISGNKFGSMHGNQVNFIVSGSGAGVEYDGILMGDDDINITADGDIKFNKVASSKNVNVESKSGAVEVGTADASSKLDSKAGVSKNTQGTTTVSVKSKTTTTKTETKTDVTTTETKDNSAEANETANTKAKFVSGQNVRLAGKTVKAQDALVSGKNNVNLQSSATEGFGVDIENSIVSGDNVNVQANAVKVDAASKVLADVADIQADSLVQFDGLLYANDAKVELSGENSQLNFQGKLVANNAKLSATNIDAHSLDATAGSLELDSTTVNLNDANVKTNTLSVEIDKATSASQKFQTNDSTSITTNTFSVSGKDGVNLESKTDFESVDSLLTKVIANNKVVTFDNILIDKNTEVTSFSANKVLARDSFVNYGIFNTSGRHLTEAGTFEGDETSVVLNAGKKFANYGLLLADRLAVKAGEKITLDGSTFTTSDLTLISPEVSQMGEVTVGGNVNAITDKYHVESKFTGEVQVKAGDTSSATQYSDWRARRDLYTITTQIGQLDGSAIKVEGGKIVVKGDFTIVPLAGSKYAKGTTSEGKQFSDVQNQNRLEAVNADIYVGGNLSIDGSISSKVNAFEANVLDLLKVNSNKISIKYQPRTWINTGLMRTKTQEFNSLFDMFQGMFGNSNNFSWHNGAYQMKGEFIINTLAGSLKDAYTNQILAVVFGSDWRNQSFNNLKAKWNNFIANPNDFKVALWAPGAQIVTGGAIDQINGNLDLGADKASTHVLTDAKGRNYAITVESATTVDTKKLTRNFNTQEELTKLTDLGLVKKVDGKFVSQFEVPYLKNVANVSLFAPEGKRTLVADNQATAQLILDQVRAKTQTYFFSTNSDANIVNGLLTSTVEFNKKLDEYKTDFQAKIKAANGNLTLINSYIDQYEKKVARLRATTDFIDFQKVDGSNNYAPVVVFSAKTLDRAKTLGASAGVLNARTAVRIHNADAVNSNHGTIAAEVVAVKANTINLRTNGVQNAVIADKSGFSANDFSLVGQASFGTSAIQAENATFEAAVGLNEHGDLVQKGRAFFKAARVDVANDLVAKGFDLVATDDAEFNVGGNLDLLSKYEVASRFSQELLKGTYGSKSLKEKAYTVKGSSIVGDENTTVNVGGDLKLDSSRLASDSSLNVNVAGDLETEAKANVYDAESHTERLDITLGGRARFGSAAAVGTINLGSNEGGAALHGNTDKNAAVTKAGEPTVQGGFSIGYKKATDTVVETKTANNAFDSSNLNVNVERNADLSNTDINKAARAIAVKRAEEAKEDVVNPTATITADSVTTANQAIDTASRTHDESGFKVGIEAYAGGAVTDTLSHITSAARAKSNGEALDGTLALTAVGDATGLMTRDLVHTGVRAQIGGSGMSAKSETLADNRNAMAGDVAIKSKSDLQLKAVDGEKLGNVKLEAGSDLIVEGGKSTTKSDSKSWNVGATLDLGVGASAQGAAASLSGTLSGGGQFSSAESTAHQNSDLHGSNVEMSANNIDLKSTTVQGKEVKVEAADKLSVTSEQDTVKSTTNGFGLSVTGGASVNTAKLVTPFASAGVSYNHHKVDNAVVADQSGITADEKLEIKADKAELVGSKVVAKGKETAKVEFNTVEASDIEDHRYEDGGSVGVSVGVNKYGNTSVDFSGGRDKQDRYSATNHATVAGQGVDVSDKVIKGEVNDVAEAAVAVHKDVQIQDTAFGITVNETVVDTVKKGAVKVAEAANKVAEKIKDAAAAVGEKLSGMELPDVTLTAPEGGSTETTTTDASVTTDSTTTTTTTTTTKGTSGTKGGKKEVVIYDADCNTCTASIEDIMNARENGTSFGGTGSDSVSVVGTKGSVTSVVVNAGASSNSSASNNSSTRFIVKNGVAYPVYYPHGTLAGKVSTNGGTLVEGTIINGEVVATDGHSYSFGDGYYGYESAKTSSTSTTVTYYSNGKTHTAKWNGSTHNSGDIYGGSHGTYGTHGSTTGTHGTLAGAGSSPVQPSVPTTGNRPAQPSTPTAGNTGSQPFDPLVGSGVTRPTTSGYNPDGSAWAEVPVAGYDLRPNNNGGYTSTTTTGSYYGTEHTSSSSSSTSGSYTNVVFDNAYNPCTCDATSTTTTTTTTTTTSDHGTSYSDVTSTFSDTTSSAGVLPPRSHLETIDNQGNDTLVNYFEKFNKTGNVDTTLSGSYSEIFAGKAGNATPGKGGGLTDVESADQLLHIRNNVEFSNFDNTERELQETLNKVKAEQEALRKQLEEAKKANNTEVVTTLTKQIEAVTTTITETKEQLNAVTVEKGRITTDERNSIDYVRPVVDVDPAVAPNTPVDNGPAPRVVESDRNDGTLAFEGKDTVEHVNQDNDGHLVIPPTTTPVVDFNNNDDKPISPAGNGDDSSTVTGGSEEVAKVVINNPATVPTVQPENPVEPTPVDPVNPTPVEPVNPTPVDPVNPTPVDPVNPTPVDPVNPTPVDPVNPTPVDPVNPTPVDPVDPVTPVDPAKPVTPPVIDPSEPGTGGNDNGGSTPNNRPVVEDNGTDLNKLRDEIKTDFRDYADTVIPGWVDKNINFDDSATAFLDGLPDGNINVTPISTGKVSFASAKPRRTVDVAVPTNKPSYGETAHTGSKVKFSSAHRRVERPAVTEVASNVPVQSVPTTPVVTEEPKGSKVSFASGKHRERAGFDVNPQPQGMKITLAGKHGGSYAYANEPEPVASNGLVSEINDTIDTLSCANPLVNNLSSRIDTFRGDALVINRGISVQPNFEAVRSSINDYTSVFEAGHSYNNTDDLRTDLGYRTATAQKDAERQDSLKRKQIDLITSQLQTVASQMEQLRTRAVSLREAAHTSDVDNQEALGAELNQIKQQEASLLKQYKDLRNAIYSLTDGYNFGFTVTNKRESLNKLLENLTVVGNGNDAKYNDDVYVTIQNLDTYLYGNQSVKYSSVQKVKRVVTFDNYANNSADYNDDAKLYEDTQEAISVNAKNLRMRVANLHLELKALADDYRAIQDRASKLTDENEKAQYAQKLDYVKVQVQNIIGQLSGVNLTSNVDLVKTMAYVTTIENQVHEVRNQVSELLGGKVAAVKFANAGKSEANNSVLEEKSAAQAIVASITGGQTLAGGVKVYNPQDTDVLTKTEVSAVNKVADLRAKARKQRQERTINEVDTDTKTN